MLARDGQRLAVSFPVLEQISLVAFERRSRDFGRRRDSVCSAPFQKHLHVDAAKPQRALGESLNSKMLEVLFQKRSEWCGAESP